MTPERWEELKPILSEALERDAADRLPYIDQVCHGREDLREDFVDTYFGPVFRTLGPCRPPGHTPAKAQQYWKEARTSLASATLLPVTSVAGIVGDGLTADGKGDLFITDPNFIDEYNIASGVLTAGTAVIPGVQDVALNPSSGLPQPPIAPEPGTMSLFGVSLLGMAAWRLRRRARK